MIAVVIGACAIEREILLAAHTAREHGNTEGGVVDPRAIPGRQDVLTGRGEVGRIGVSVAATAGTCPGQGIGRRLMMLAQTGAPARPHRGHRVGVLQSAVATATANKIGKIFRFSGTAEVDRSTGGAGSTVAVVTATRLYIRIVQVDVMQTVPPEIILGMGEIVAVIPVARVALGAASLVVGCIGVKLVRLCSRHQHRLHND
jgi:hypothetical protein